MSLRVAIIGAGLAGLACAHELERHGLQAEIFEQHPEVGRRPAAAEVVLSFMNAEPTRDAFNVLGGSLGLPVHPAHHIRRAVVQSATQAATIEGNVGYSVLRGPQADSLERQLAKHVRSPIRHGESPDPAHMRLEYDWVVVAAGSPAPTRALKLWEGHIQFGIRGATVVGEFDPTELHFYLRTRYSRTGWAMIAPMDGKRASVGVGVPDCTPEELESHWQTFRSEMSHLWEFEEESIRFDPLEIGRSRLRQMGNVLLVGQSGGFTDPLALCGVYPGLASGVYAARHIATGDDGFRRFTEDWDQRYTRWLRIRRALCAWTDVQFDRAVRLARMGGGQVLIRSPWNLAGCGAAMVELFPGS